MKKTIINVLLSVFTLSAVFSNTLSTSVPAVEKEETVIENTNNLDNLMNLDIMDLSEDEINDIFSNASDEENWLRYSAMSEEEQAYVMQTYAFNHKLQVATYRETENGELVLIDDIEEVDYLDYLQETFNKVEADIYWNRTGESYICICYPWTEGKKVNVQKLSYTSAANDYNSSRLIKIALAEPDSWVKGEYAYYSLIVSSIQTEANDKGKYTLGSIPLNFHGVKGFSYVPSTEYSNVICDGGMLKLASANNTNASAWQKIAASTDFDDTVFLHINLWRNSTLGCYESNGGAVASKLYIDAVPNTYSMAYDANGGTGSIPSQTNIRYVDAESYPNPPTAPYCLVKFDANGGYTPSTQEALFRQFNGWNTNKYAASGEKGSYRALTAVDKSTVTNYAIWGAAEGTITFPAPTKTGYRFDGWGSDKIRPGDAKVSINEDKTYTANWIANTYYVQLDAKGVLLENDYITAEVDKEFVLPAPTRTGYEFIGWSTDNGHVYSPGVQKNLAYEHNKTIRLTARFAGQLVDYTVKYYFQEAPSSNNFIENTEMRQTLQARAETQENVIAKTVLGYLTPAAQLVTIEPDGSTVVEFKYLLEADNAPVSPSADPSYEPTTSPEPSVDESKPFVIRDKYDLKYVVANGEATLVDVPNNVTSIKITQTLTYKEKNYPVVAIAKNAFRKHYKLRKVSIPRFVRSIGDNAFIGCKDLRTINWPNGITSIGANAFRNCDSLTDINIPSKIKSIGKNAFYGCDNLKTVKFTSKKTPSIGAKCFKNIKKGSVIKVPAAKKKAYSKALKGKYSAKKTSIK